jgi:flagellar FliJ protein
MVLMKKFQFKLDPLITIRKRKEDSEIRNLSIIVSQVNNLNDEKNSLQHEIQLMGDSISQNIQKGISIKDYFEYSDVNRTLGLKINSLDKQINEKQPELDLARIRVDHARKEKKILEILRENSLKEYKKKIQKQEKLELEEFLTTLEFNKLTEQEESSIGQNENNARTFKILTQEDKTDENLPEDFKKLKSIYDKFAKK